MDEYSNYSFYLFCHNIKSRIKDKKNVQIRHKQDKTERKTKKHIRGCQTAAGKEKDSTGLTKEQEGKRVG